jgi:hypothetical protein
VPYSQLKRLAGELRSELKSLRVSLQEQIGAIRTAYEAEKEARDQIPVRLSEIRVPENEKREAHAYRNKHYAVQVILAVGTCGAFLAAAIYAGIAARELCQIKKSNEIAAESLQSVQRAFLNFDQVDITPFERVHHPNLVHAARFVAMLSNSGATPARNVSYFFNVDQLDEPPEGSTFIGGKILGQSYAGPKSPLNIGPIQKDISFITGMDDATFIREITTESFTLNRHIYMWGWVTYDDVFPNTKRHLTEFCMKLLIIIMNPKDQTIRFGTGGCGIHNCDDETCKDYDALLSQTR